MRNRSFTGAFVATTTACARTVCTPAWTHGCFPPSIRSTWVPCVHARVDTRMLPAFDPVHVGSVEQAAAIANNRPGETGEVLERMELGLIRIMDAGPRVEEVERHAR